MQRNIVLNFQIWSFFCCLAKAICIGWSFALPHIRWRKIASFLIPQFAPSCLVLLNEQNRSFYKDWYLTQKEKKSLSVVSSFFVKGTESIKMLIRTNIPFNMVNNNTSESFWGNIKRVWNLFIFYRQPIIPELSPVVITWHSIPGLHL